MDETTTSFGYWVRRQRRALDLTQRALADCVGCSAVTIKKIEADERRPSLQMAERLAMCLRIADDQRARFLAVAQRERAVDALLLATTAATPLVAPYEHHLLRPYPHPLPATRFVGRAREMQAIEARLLHEGCRLLTVVGLGGVGKTRLALEAMAALAHLYPEGVCFVPLADTEGVDAVAGAVLRRLGLPLVGSVDAALQLAHALRQRHLLLVLDNFEHLLRDGEAANMLSDLLVAAPRVALLVTSRERLNLQAEWVLPLDGLPLDEPAFTLFTERARRVGQDVAHDAAAVAAICQLVDGLPLALELAAGWTSLLTLEQIAAQLRDGLDLLQTRLRDLPKRHRSVDALFDQSWALLTADERDVWMRMAVFRGGFDRAAVANVTGADLPAILGLVEKSLVRADSSGRYGLHALARHYAAARLAAADATADARQRHADYYLALLQQAADQGDTAASARWLDRVEAERANILAAWQWWLEEGRWSTLWSAARPLFDFWMRRGSWAEGIDLLLRAVRHAPPDDSSAYAASLIALATLLARSGRVAEAVPYGHEGYRRALQSEEPPTIAMAEMYVMGMLSTDVIARKRHFQAAIAAWRQANNRQLLATALLLYGDSLRDQGAREEARACYAECLTHARASGDGALAFYALGNQGRLALLDGDIEHAYRLFAECVVLARAQRNPIALADWLLRLGVVQVYRREPTAAQATLVECVGLAEDLHHQHCLTNARVWLAAATLQQGDATAAQHVLQLSLAEYATRLHGHTAANPSTAELIEALVIAAQTCVAQRHDEQAAMALGCAEALAAQPQAQVDPLLAALAGRLRAQLAGTLHQAALEAALARGRAASALVCFTSLIC